jgi:DNA-binding protein HU-beta
MGPAGIKPIFLRRNYMAAGLTKTQLIRHLAEKTELPNKTAAAFLEQLADTAIKETKKNGIFVVPGLGRLVKAHRKARVGRNPQTGEPIQIKAKTVVKFRVAKAAKDAIAPKKYLLREIMQRPASSRPLVFHVGTAALGCPSSEARQPGW